MSLEIKKEMDEIRKLYAEDKTQDSFNLLLIGETGSGKTHLLQTCRRPIHIDSFDIGGTKIPSIRKGIEEGWIIVDSRWEHENPFKPSVIDDWAKVMESRIKMSYFNALGTYCLDSMTSWTEAIMNRTLKKAGLAAHAPRFTHDYMPTKTDIRNFTSELLKLPCDFVLTGHLRADKDEVVGTVAMRLVTIGDLDIKLPSLFDEIWVTQVKDGSKGPDYSILTSPKGYYKTVRTRIGSGKFDQFEKPDVRYLLQKAGREVKDIKLEEASNA
jgi:hypothetical protein